MALYPFIEHWVTGDNREHHVLDRPRNAPTRTGLGVMSSRLRLILLAAGATTSWRSCSRFRSTRSRTSSGCLFFLLPPIAYVVTRRTGLLIGIIWLVGSRSER